MTTHDPMLDYGLSPLELMLRELWFPSGVFANFPRPDRPFALRLSRHGTVVLTDYPFVHRKLPALCLSYPCTICGARTVHTDSDRQARCAKCGEPRVL